MEENQPIASDFELGNSLKPVSSLTPEDARAERARINKEGMKHPYYQDGPDHMHWVKRMEDLCLAGAPPKTELSRALEKDGISTPEDVQKAFAAGQEAFDREQMERQISKAQDELRSRLAAEGKKLEPIEARKMIADSVSFVDTLTKSGVLHGKFAEFLEDTGLGNDVALVRTFYENAELDRKFREWLKEQK